MSWHDLCFLPIYARIYEYSDHLWPSVGYRISPALGWARPMLTENRIPMRRPAMNESAAAPGGRTAVVGALDECDVDAAAATRRWARARELQRRAKALGLRMS